MDHVQYLAFEASSLCDLGRRQRKRSQRSSVKAVEETDELLATGRVHRELQRSLDCFSAAIREVCARRRFDGHDGIELLCELRHVAVVEIGAAHVNQLFCLLLDCFDYFRMAVAGGTDG